MFHSHLVHFTANWYILGYFVYLWSFIIFDLVLVYCTKKNLVTLYYAMSLAAWSCKASMTGLGAYVSA
jgi:hypothetical protein